jgi:hypothetical protein
MLEIEQLFISSILGRGYALPPIRLWPSVCTVEPGYDDIGLYDTSPVAPDILWYQLIPHCWS